MPAEAGTPEDQTDDSGSTPGPISSSTPTPAPTAKAPTTRGRQPRAARGKVDPNHPPFTGYLERDALRQSREKGRRRTLYVSIALHVVVFAGLLVYSLFQVEELWSPSVEVKVFSPSKLPPGVKERVGQAASQPVTPR
jgi:hypothetical protein